MPLFIHLLNAFLPSSSSSVSSVQTLIIDYLQSSFPFCSSVRSFQKVTFLSIFSWSFFEAFRVTARSLSFLRAPNWPSTPFWVSFETAGASRGAAMIAGGSGAAEMTAGGNCAATPGDGSKGAVAIAGTAGKGPVELETAANKDSVVIAAEITSGGDGAGMGGGSKGAVAIAGAAGKGPVELETAANKDSVAMAGGPGKDAGVTMAGGRGAITGGGSKGVGARERELSIAGALGTMSATAGNGAGVGVEVTAETGTMKGSVIVGRLVPEFET